MQKFAFDYRNSSSGALRRLYQPVMPDSINGVIAAIGASIVWASFVFVVFPDLDLVVSRWFVSGQTFVWADNPFLLDVRAVGRLAQPYIIGSMIMLIAVQMVLPEPRRFCSFRKPLFVLLSFAAGPLVVAQSLKVLIGRVRPRAIVEFGGTVDFTPVWQFSAACSRSCSFPSGESSAAAASLSLLLLVPARFRWAAALLFVPCLMFVAFNRVVLGAHFLSDVVLGWLLTMFAMAWVWRWMSARRNRGPKL